MKIQLGDKVVAKPIVMKIGEVPIFALPFYYKSLVSGRRSGILFPSFEFGFSSREGRYIRDFGYYWATNDPPPPPGDQETDLTLLDKGFVTLTPLQYEVTQNHGTERAFTGVYWDLKDDGTYHCIVCDTELFSSDTKYDSGTGWPR